MSPTTRRANRLTHYLKKISIGWHLIAGYRALIASVEYMIMLMTFFTIIILIYSSLEVTLDSPVLIIYYLAKQTTSTAVDISSIPPINFYLLFSYILILLLFPFFLAITYLYLLYKSDGSLSVSFILRFKGVSGLVNLVLLGMYGFSIFLTEYAVTVTIASHWLRHEMININIPHRNVIIQNIINDKIVNPIAFTLGGTSRINTDSFFIDILSRLANACLERPFEMILAFTGITLSIFLLIFYESSEFASGEVSLYIHKYMLRKIMKLFKASHRKIVVAGYGNFGKAIVKGIIENLSTPKHSRLELSYAYAWEEGEDSITLRSLASNIAIISKDAEDWDYRIDHPVYKDLGAEIIEYSIGQSHLVPVLGPNLRSNFLLKEIKAINADLFIQTFRDPMIETYLHSELHSQIPSRFAGNVAIRCTTAPIFSLTTSRDIEGKLFRYYPEYVFANLLLRRLYMELLSAIRVNENMPILVITLGRGKTLYYVVKALSVLMNNVTKDIADEFERRGIRIYQLDNPDLHIISALRISNEDEVKDRIFTLNNLSTIINGSISQLEKELILGEILNGLGVAYKVVSDDPFLRARSGIFIAPIRHVISNEDKRTSRLAYLHIYSEPTEFTTVFKVSKQCVKHGIYPIYVISSTMEGETFHSTIEVLKSWEILNNEFGHLANLNHNFSIVASVMNENESAQLYEASSAYGFRNRLSCVNVYKTVKEEICSYASLLIGGESSNEY